MRAFLAVALREPVAGEARRLLERLQALVPAVRWVRPEGLHITLRFFGRIGEVDAARMVDALAPAARAAAPFELGLGELGGFPTPRDPRVLFVAAAEGAVPLARLAAGCERRLEAAGFGAEERPFHAHCTLGRPRAPWPAAARAAWREAVAAGTLPAPGAMVADRLTLFESLPGRGGSRYLERAVVPLGGARRSGEE